MEVSVEALDRAQALLLVAGTPALTWNLPTTHQPPPPRIPPPRRAAQTDYCTVEGNGLVSICANCDRATNTGCTQCAIPTGRKCVSRWGHAWAPHVQSLLGVQQSSQLAVGVPLRDRLTPNPPLLVLAPLQPAQAEGADQLRGSRPAGLQPVPDLREGTHAVQGRAVVHACRQRVHRLQDRQVLMFHLECLPAGQRRLSQASSSWPHELHLAALC